MRTGTTQIAQREQGMKSMRLIKRKVTQWLILGLLFVAGFTGTAEAVDNPVIASVEIVVVEGATKDGSGKWWVCQKDAPQVESGEEEDYVVMRAKITPDWIPVSSLTWSSENHDLVPNLNTNWVRIRKAQWKELSSVKVVLNYKVDGVTVAEGEDSEMLGIVKMEQIGATPKIVQSKGEHKGSLEYRVWPSSRSLDFKRVSGSDIIKEGGNGLLPVESEEVVGDYRKYVVAIELSPLEGGWATWNTDDTLVVRGYDKKFDYCYEDSDIEAKKFSRENSFGSKVTRPGSQPVPIPTYTKDIEGTPDNIYNSWNVTDTTNDTIPNKILSVDTPFNRIYPGGSNYKRFYKQPNGLGIYDVGYQAVNSDTSVGQAAVVKSDDMQLEGSGSYHVQGIFSGYWNSAKIIGKYGVGVGYQFDGQEWLQFDVAPMNSADGYKKNGGEVEVEMGITVTGSTKDGAGGAIGMTVTFTTDSSHSFDLGPRDTQASHTTAWTLSSPDATHDATEQTGFQLKLRAAAEIETLRDLDDDWALSCRSSFSLKSPPGVLTLLFTPHTTF